MNITVIKVEATIIDATFPSVVVEVVDINGNKHNLRFVPAVLEDMRASMSNVYFGEINVTKQRNLDY